MKSLLILLATSFQCLAAQSVTLAWNPNSETNLVGYRLYVGNAAGVYTTSYKIDAPKTEFTVTNILPATTYFFAVTAFTDELESEKSDEISWRSAPVPPAKPAGLRITTSLQAFNPESNRWTNAWTISAPVDPGSQLFRRLGLAIVELQPQQIGRP